MTKEERAALGKTAYEWYTSHHICVSCHQRNAEPNKVRCTECLEINRRAKSCKPLPESKNIIRQKARKRYTALKDAGLCVRCGKRPSYNHGVLCIDCTMENRTRSKRYRSRMLIKTDFSDGLCSRCNEPALPGKKLCQRHYDAIASNLTDEGRARARENHIWKKYIQMDVAEANHRRATHG